MRSEPPVQRRVFVSGRVQAVFFRQTTRERARELGLSGWVRNRRDGRVEAVFQGPPGAVDAIIGWCHEGPPSAQVDDVDVSDEDPEPFPGFSIRSTE